MTMATRLSHYLNEHHIRFQTLSHEHSHSSLHSGIAAGVPLNHLAKGVVLEDHDGKHMMAILPANAKINLAILNDEMNATFHLVIVVVRCTEGWGSIAFEHLHTCMHPLFGSGVCRIADNQLIRNSPMDADPDPA